MQDIVKIKDNVTKEVNFEDSHLLAHLYGERNENLKEVENVFGIKVYTRGGKMSLVGGSEDVESAERFLREIYRLVQKGYTLVPGDIELAARVVLEAKTPLEDIFLDTVCISTRKRIIAPKSLNQKYYIDAIRKNDIVFGVGPAGTGKTYLAMAMAVSEFLSRKVSRIILTRPAVEAGEKLGFLPGDLQQKIDPYLKPLFDALYDMMDFEKASRLIERGPIEIAPLAYMRGRTLNDAFIILDEAQNTTTMQMKMFLTRLGFNSKVVITGDLTQVDLERGERSGLHQAIDLLKDVEGIAIVRFSRQDVVRHPLVRHIIDAYEELERSEKN
ncbi:MAG: PhoH family protein [Candidatus Methanosuratincola sp.]|jgi:phosphate starvation-inducible PhoH-like protein